MRGGLVCWGVWLSLSDEAIELGSCMLLAMLDGLMEGESSQDNGRRFWVEWCSMAG